MEREARSRVVRAISSEMQPPLVALGASLSLLCDFEFTHDKADASTFLVTFYSR